MHGEMKKTRQRLGVNGWGGGGGAGRQVLAFQRRGSQMSGCCHYWTYGGWDGGANDAPQVVAGVVVERLLGPLFVRLRASGESTFNLHDRQLIRGILNRPNIFSHRRQLFLDHFTVAYVTRRHRW